MSDQLTELQFPGQFGIQFSLISEGDGNPKVEVDNTKMWGYLGPFAFTETYQRRKGQFTLKAEGPAVGKIVRVEMGGVELDPVPESISREENCRRWQLKDPTQLKVLLEQGDHTRNFWRIGGGDSTNRRLLYWQEKTESTAVSVTTSSGWSGNLASLGEQHKAELRGTTGSEKKRAEVHFTGLQNGSFRADVQTDTVGPKGSFLPLFSHVGPGKDFLQMALSGASDPLAGGWYRFQSVEPPEQTAAEEKRAQWVDVTILAVAIFLCFVFGQQPSFEQGYWENNWTKNNKRTRFRIFLWITGVFVAVAFIVRCFILADELLLSNL
jgi:hypothetical protein